MPGSRLSRDGILNKEALLKGKVVCASGAGVRNLKVAASSTMPIEKREMSATDEFEESRPNSPHRDGVAALKRQDSLTGRSLHFKQN